MEVQSLTVITEEDHSQMKVPPPDFISPSLIHHQMKNPKPITDTEADALLAKMDDDQNAKIKTPKEKGQF